MLGDGICIVGVVVTLGVACALVWRARDRFPPLPLPLVLLTDMEESLRFIRENVSVTPGTWEGPGLLIG
jgi:hypothetical protein